MTDRPSPHDLRLRETRVGGWKRARGPVRVAVVYPNTYRVGMANLGFLTVFQHIASDPRFTADRAFLSEDERPTTLEDGWPLASVDVIAFSISFESDYLNLARILDRAGIPLLARERKTGPLILAGGVAVSMNPEPVADFVDAFVLGEAEGALAPVLDLLNERRRDRASQIEDLARLPHVYVPRFRDVTIRVALARAPDGAPPLVSPIVTPDAEFADMCVVETGRGCGRLCRFCAAGFVYLPPRPHDGDALRRAIGTAPPGSPVGLMGTAVSDRGDVAGLLAAASAGGRRASLSSIRIGNLGADDYRRLAASGGRQVALAPEAGTQRLRRVLNKGFTDDDLLAECRTLAAAGISRVKLYFMVGLPTETEDDVRAIPVLARRAKDALGKGGRVDLSVNPFVPKPHTPFQWHPMAGTVALSLAQRILNDGAARVSGIALAFESVRLARMQALLSVGDRRVAEAIRRVVVDGESWKRALAGAGLDEAFYISRERPAGEVLPWDFIDTGVTKAFPRKEYERGLAGTLTSACRLGECRRCGACG
jgi:radical SAM superfamily enzyme YgiQ (UPF0313 family)